MNCEQFETSVFKAGRDGYGSTADGTRRYQRRFVVPEKQKQSVYTKDVVLVMAASFFFMFSTMIVTPLINGFSLELGADAVFAGIICGSMSVVSLFLRPIAGNLSDRFSKFRLSTIGGALIFIGVMGYCISSEPWMLLVFRLINGTGFVLATVCMLSLIHI